MLYCKIEKKFFEEQIASYLFYSVTAKFLSSFFFFFSFAELSVTGNILNQFQVLHLNKHVVKVFMYWSGSVQGMVFGWNF